MFRLCLFLFFVATTSFGQTGIIYQEDFGSSCTPVLAQNYVGEFGSWTVVTITGNSNRWMVSARANGNEPGQCASSCDGDASLHITPYCYDSGAFYMPHVNSLRAYSPTIDCSSFNSVHLEFDYLRGNSPFETLVWYYDGSDWSAIDTLYSTEGDCGWASGWAHHAMDLPISTWANANIRIGFSWRFFSQLTLASYQIGSVAIDDIVITGHALVQDETPPVVICSAAMTLGCENFQSLADLIEVSDNLDQYPHITFSPESWNGNYENQMIEVTATDFSGNETSCSFELFFEDVVGPQLTCPNNITFGIPVNETSVLVTDMMLGEPIVTSVCMEYSLTNDFEEQNLGLGEYEIEWTLVDANNNSQSCIQSLFISQEAPQFFSTVFSDSLVEPQCTSIFVDDGFFCTGCADDNIDRVTISTLTDMILMDNIDTRCANSQGYIDYDPVEGVTTCNLTPGGTYKLFLKTAGGFTEYYSAWIDYDRDGYFDSEGEWLGGSLMSSASLTLAITIPDDMALHGYYKLRVMCNFFGFDIDCNSPPSSACIFDCFGECEDYTLRIGEFIQSAPCGNLQDYSTWSLAYDDIDPNPIITQSPIAGTIIQDSVLVTITATDNDGLSTQTSF
jgi:hypothetical protein